MPACKWLIPALPAFAGRSMHSWEWCGS